MTNTNATNFRKNLFEYLNLAIDFNDIINVNTKKGNVVIISEDEYNSLTEQINSVGKVILFLRGNKWGF